MHEFAGELEGLRVVAGHLAETVRGDWPAQRSIAGLDLPQETPIPNLYNVGDGVREYASGGVQACAETGKLVAERILAAR